MIPMIVSFCILEKKGKGLISSASTEISLYLGGSDCGIEFEPESEISAEEVVELITFF
jgi:hypothetical protein